VARLEDDDSDVRAAAVETLQAFSKHGQSLLKPIKIRCIIFFAELYQNNIKSSIPTIMKQLDHDYWRISQKAVEMLAQLFTFSAFY
jgi:HEAT repeat protein